MVGSPSSDEKPLVPGDSSDDEPLDIASTSSDDKPLIPRASAKSSRLSTSCLKASELMHAPSDSDVDDNLALDKLDFAHKDKGSKEEMQAESFPPSGIKLVWRPRPLGHWRKQRE